jgi:hypothetical protein
MSIVPVGNSVLFVSDADGRGFAADGHSCHSRDGATEQAFLPIGVDWCSPRPEMRVPPASAELTTDASDVRVRGLAGVVDRPYPAGNNGSKPPAILSPSLKRGSSR